MPDQKKPEWVYRGKSIRQLIKELRTFEDQNRTMLISINCGDSFFAVDLVKRSEASYLICNDPEITTEVKKENIDRITHGKSVRQLIKKLEHLEEEDLEVRIEINSDGNQKPVSFIGKVGVFCAIQSCSDFYSMK